MIYLGERNDVGNYLGATGWQIETHTAERRLADNQMAFHHEEAWPGSCGRATPWRH
jgi:hypothetical protein